MPQLQILQYEADTRGASVMLLKGFTDGEVNDLQVITLWCILVPKLGWLGSEKEAFSSG